jgi:hypothetical protein
VSTTPSQFEMNSTKLYETCLKQTEPWVGVKFTWLQIKNDKDGEVCVDVGKCRSTGNCL